MNSRQNFFGQQRIASVRNVSTLPSDVETPGEPETPNDFRLPAAPPNSMRINALPDTMDVPLLRLDEGNEFRI